MTIQRLKPGTVIVPLQSSMNVGWFGSDIVDAVVDVATSAIDKTKAALKDVGNAVSSLPGGNWVVDAINQGAQWTHDLANTPVGTVLFRALASTLYGPLAGSLGFAFGPQLASITWALPGLAKGDTFEEAWTTEFIYRAKTTAEILGAGPAADAIGGPMGDALSTITQWAKDAMPNVSLPDALSRLGWTPEELAKDLGIRVDVAALALNLLRRADIYNMDDYDPSSGNHKVVMIPLSSLFAVQQTLAEQQKLMELKAKTVVGPTLASAAPVNKLLAKTSLLGVNVTAAPKATSSPANPTPKVTLPPPPKGLVDALAANPNAAPVMDTANIMVDTAKSSILRELGVVLLLTSPAWLTLLVLQLPSRATR